MMAWDGTPRALGIDGAEGLVARIGSASDANAAWMLLSSARDAMRDPSVFPIAPRRGLHRELSHDSLVIMVEDASATPVAAAVCRRPEVSAGAEPSLEVMCVKERRYGDALLLEAMAVREDMRQCGIGRTIMSLVAGVAAAEGRKILVACVSPRNRAATKLMRDCGFHGLAAIRAHRYGGTGRIESTLVMAKRVAGTSRGQI